VLLCRRIRLQPRPRCLDGVDRGLSRDLKIVESDECQVGGSRRGGRGHHLAGRVRVCVPVRLHGDGDVVEARALPRLRGPKGYPVAQMFKERGQGPRTEDHRGVQHDGRRL
jgi:hypothetical protein